MNGVVAEREMGFWPRNEGARVLVLGLGYGVIALLCLTVSRFGTAIESIWLSNALLVAVLVVSSSRLWPVLFLSAGLGHLTAHVLVGDDLDFALAILVSDLFETLLCAAVLKRSPKALAFEDKGGLLYFFAAIVISALVSTVVVAGTTAAIGQALSVGDLLVWFAVDTLGLIVFLPVFYGFNETHWRRLREKRIRLLLTLALVVAVAVVGAWSQSPIARLIMLPIFVILAFDFGVAGVIAGLSALLLTWTTFAVVGEPRDGWPYPDMRTYLLMAQGYMAALAVTIVPIAVILQERERLNLQLAAAAKEEAAKLEAEKANAFKSRLIAMASHDLRQPLLAAQAYVEALEGRLNGRPEGAICKSAGHALDAMTNILDSLLDVSRLDAGILAPQPHAFAVDQMLERVAASNRPQAEAKGLRLEVRGSDCNAISDPNLLERVVDNFTTNAIRYTERGSVTLSCEAHADRLIIAVADSGIGVAPEALETIFADYVQLNNPDRDRRKGLGLGLAIAKRMAELLGHRINVRSVVGEGSTFSIDVPRAAETRSAAGPAQLGEAV